MTDTTATSHMNEPVRAIRPREHPGADALLASFANMSFQARNLGQAAELLETMVREKNVFKVLTLAGALIPAGLSETVRTMIENRMVDVIISTGANMSHDTIEGFGYHHYKSTNLKTDVELREAYINRIYDTFLAEEAFVGTEEKLLTLYPDYNGVTSADFTEFLGNVVEKPCVLKTAAEYKVPIFIPALSDSELGITINRYNALNRGGHQVRWDGLADNEVFADMMKHTDTQGIVICGGGVPRNWAQQVTPLLEYLNLAEGEEYERSLPGYKYGIQITTDVPHFGGMSGCTFSESISWGKYDVDARYVRVSCDTTIALPLIVAAAIARL